MLSRRPATAHFARSLLWGNLCVAGSPAFGPQRNPTGGRVMRNLSFARAVACSLAISAMLAAPTAYAKTIKFEAKLDASQEVPPNDSKGTGTAEVTYNTGTKKLSWTLEYSGLTGPATGAHFHGPAEAGKSADVAVPIKGD